MAKAKAPARATASKAGSAKKTAANKAGKAPPSNIRGAALVDLVIAKFKSEGGILSGCGIPKHAAKGMDPGKLAKLALPDGRPLPPSLTRFLAYDETYLGVLKKGALAFQSFNKMMEAEFDKATREMYSFFSTVLSGHCLVLPQGADSRRFLYFGQPDAHGEYPKAALLDQAARNFHGFVSIGLGNDPEPAEVDGRPGFEVLAELFPDGPMADYLGAMAG